MLVHCLRNNMITDRFGISVQSNRLYTQIDDNDSKNFKIPWYSSNIIFKIRTISPRLNKNN